MKFYDVARCYQLEGGRDFEGSSVSEYAKQLKAFVGFVMQKERRVRTDARGARYFFTCLIT